MRHRLDIFEEIKPLVFLRIGVRRRISATNQSFLDFMFLSDTFKIIIFCIRHGFGTKTAHFANKF